MSFDTTTNFWEANPAFLAIKEFKDLYSKDKSKKRATSSKLMWGVALLVDPHEANPLRNTNMEDKVQIIVEDFAQHLSTEEHATYIVLYESLCITSIQRTILNLGRKLDERDKFLMSTHYNLDNAKDLDALIANTKKLKELYDVLVEELDKEQQGAGQTRGGRTESASEKREL